MKRLLLLLIPTLALAQTDSIKFSTTNGKVKEGTSGVGSVGKPFDFTDVSTIGISGGSGSPGGSNQQIQFNNAAAFGGVPYLTYNGTTVTQQGGTRFNLVDPTNTSKKITLDLSGVGVGTTNFAFGNTAGTLAITADIPNYLESILTGGLNAITTPKIYISEPGAFPYNTGYEPGIKVDNSNGNTYNKWGITVTSISKVVGPVVHTTGIQSVSYTPPDSGGDGSAIYALQSGGGNAMSVYNRSDSRPIDPDTGLQYPAYPNNGFALEAYADGNKHCIVAMSHNGYAVWGQVHNTGGTSFNASPGDDDLNNTRRAFRISDKANTVERFFVTLDGTIKTNDKAWIGTSISGTPSQDVISGGGVLVKDGDFFATRTDGATTTTTPMLSLNHDSTGTPGTGFGTDINLTLETTTTPDVLAGLIRASWVTATHASRVSELDLFAADNATARGIRVYGDGGAALNNSSHPGIGIFAANAGYWVGTAASTSGKILKSDGTKFTASTETYAAPGTSGNVMTSDGTNWLSSPPSGGGATTFLGLTDTPSSYTGQGGKAIRVNAGETALEFFSAAGSGTVTQVNTTSPISGGPITTTGTLSLLTNVDFSFTNQQTLNFDQASNLVSRVLRLRSNNTAAVGGTGLGSSLTLGAETSTTDNQDQGQLGTAWSDATHSTRSAYMDFLLVNSGAALASKMRLFPSGGLSVNNTTDPGAGVISANTGYKVGSTEWPIASNGIPNRTGTYTYSALTAPSGAIVGTTDTQTLTNKRITKRVGTTTSSATPTINTDNVDVFRITAQTVDITSMTTNLSGTPTDGQTLYIAITGTASRAITWGASFEDGAATLPTTTSGTDRLDVVFVWNTVTSKWRCLGTKSAAGGSIDDTAFGATWNGATTVGPSQNAVYDWGHTFDTDDDGKVNVLDQVAGIAVTNSSGVLQTPITDNSGNWNTAFTDRLKWDGGATDLVASTGRTSLGGTTVGQNIFTLTNPSAITFLRMNADNTVTARSATDFKTDLSLTIGTDVEAWDTQLDSLAGLTYTGNTLKVVRVNAGETGFELATISGGSVDDTAFASSWNGVTTTAPSKNAVYDWGHTFDTDDDGKVNVLDLGAGVVRTDVNGVVSISNVTGSGSVVLQDGPILRNSAGTSTSLDANNRILYDSSGAVSIQWGDAANIVLGPTTTNGIVKRTSGVIGDAVAGTDYVAPDTQLTSLAALSYTGNSLKVVRVNAGETDFELATPAGGGTVTHTGGALTSNAVVLGSGTDDVKVVTGITSDGTSKLTLGVAGTSVGSIDFKNATSGTITLAPVTGALGTVTLSLPAATDTLIGKATTDTVTNKRVTKRALSTAGPGATPTLNTDNFDVAHFTAIAANITSMTTNLSGTPVQGDQLRIDFTDDGTARTISWGASFEDGAAPLPTTTVISTRLDTLFFWNTATSKWRCMASSAAVTVPTIASTSSVLKGDGAGNAVAATSGTDYVTPTGSETLTNKTIGDGALTLAENASVALDPAGSADGKYSGITITGTAGYTQAFGDLVYLDPTDSRWEAVDIDSAAGADGDARGLIGMVVVAGTDGTACTILLQGVIRADAKFPTLTIGAPVYAAGATAGTIQVAQPTGTDQVIRIVGYALTADEIYFNPSGTWTTHT